MTKVIFVHGWGFDANYWNDVRNELSGIETHCVDMGFFGNSKPITDEAIYVTHSMGLAWTLQFAAPKSLVVLNGFTRFVPVMIGQKA